MSSAKNKKTRSRATKESRDPIRLNASQKSVLLVNGSDALRAAGELIRLGQRLGRSLPALDQALIAAAESIISHVSAAAKPRL
jgi:hypothetical protein